MDTFTVTEITPTQQVRCSNMTHFPSEEQTKTLITGSVFFLFVLPFVVVDFPCIPLGATSACMIGATLMVLGRVVTQDEVYDEVIGKKEALQTIFLLLGMMLLAQYFEREKLIHKCLDKFLKSDIRFENYIWRVCLMCFLLSAIFTNDTCGTILTPLLLRHWQESRGDSAEIETLLLGIATSSNIGSVVTVFGNPQMVYLSVFTSNFHDSKLDMKACMIYLLAPAILGFIINVVLLIVHYHSKKNCCVSRIEYQNMEEATNFSQIHRQYGAIMPNNRTEEICREIEHRILTNARSVDLHQYTADSQGSFSSVRASYIQRDTERATSSTVAIHAARDTGANQQMARSLPTSTNAGDMAHHNLYPSISHTQGPDHNVTISETSSQNTNAHSAVLDSEKPTTSRIHSQDSHSASTQIEAATPLLGQGDKTDQYKRVQSDDARSVHFASETVEIPPDSCIQSGVVPTAPPVYAERGYVNQLDQGHSVEDYPAVAHIEGDPGCCSRCCTSIRIRGLDTRSIRMDLEEWEIITLTQSMLAVTGSANAKRVHQLARSNSVFPETQGWRGIVFKVVLILLLLAIVVLFFVGSLTPYYFDLGLVPMAAAGLAMLADALVNQSTSMQIIKRADWSVILLFLAIFVWVHGFNNTCLPTFLWNKISDDPSFQNIKQKTLLIVFVTLGSNIFSNVPLVIMVSNQLDPQADQMAVVLLLAWCSTIAGNLTKFGSVCNMIVDEKGERTLGQGLGLGRFSLFGVPSTLVIMVTGLVIILGIQHINHT